MKIKDGETGCTKNIHYFQYQDASSNGVDRNHKLYLLNFRKQIEKEKRQLENVSGLSVPIPYTDTYEPNMELVLHKNSFVKFYV